MTEPVEAARAALAALERHGVSERLPTTTAGLVRYLGGAGAVTRLLAPGAPRGSRAWRSASRRAQRWLQGTRGTRRPPAELQRLAQEEHERRRRRRRRRVRATFDGDVIAYLGAGRRSDRQPRGRSFTVELSPREIAAALRAHDAGDDEEAAALLYAAMFDAYGLPRGAEPDDIDTLELR